MGARSTVELMVLALTGTICTLLLLTGLSVAIIEILDPTVDTSGTVSTLTDLLSMILGALLGLLAGRTEQLHQRATTTTADADAPDRS